VLKVAFPFWRPGSEKIVENRERAQQRIIERRRYFENLSGIQRTNKSKETRRIKKNREHFKTVTAERSQLGEY